MKTKRPTQKAPYGWVGVAARRLGLTHAAAVTLRFARWRDDMRNGCRKYVTARSASRMEVARFLRDARRRSRVGWTADLAQSRDVSLRLLVSHWREFCRVFGHSEETRDAPDAVRRDFAEFLDLKLEFSDSVEQYTARAARVGRAPRAAPRVRRAPVAVAVAAVSAERPVLYAATATPYLGDTDPRFR